ncbi:MAG: SET domain-containing protein [Pirellulaceae bacterium]
MARTKAWDDRPPKGKRSRMSSGSFRVSRTAVGKGVFTTRSYLVGEVVGEITGTTIDDPAYSSRYSFDLEDGTQLEPETPFRFVNHSCDPNCCFEVIDVNDAQRRTQRRQLMLFAIYPICAGDELTIDYNWPASFAIPCKCRSEYCRGQIMGEPE